MVRFCALLATAAVLVLPLSGCATAIRALSVADGLSSVADALDPARPSTPTPRASTDGAIYAVVSGTGGSGLRLNREPGADRLGVLPDGTLVEVLCRATGRAVDGPYGPTPLWSSVRAPDGRTGFSSDAFLRFDVDPEAVAPC